MIVLNKNWNNEVLKRTLLDIIQPSFDSNIYSGECNDPYMTMVDGICTESYQQFAPVNFGSGTQNGSGASANAAVDDALTIQNFNKVSAQNFSIVTEKFLKTLDKFYAKLYNEDFNTNVFYGQHIISIYQGLAKPDYNGAAYSTLATKGAHQKYKDKNFGDFQINRYTPFPTTGINPNDFKVVIDRMISLGLMDEEDRLDIKDQCFLYNLKKNDIQIVNNETEKTIDIICTKISDVVPDIKTKNLSTLEGVDETSIGSSVEHQFHKDKRLFLLFTPWLKNEATVKYNTLTDFVPEEPTTMQINKRRVSYNEVRVEYTGTSHEPVAYFKPKKFQTKFNKGSLPMATHLIWRIGTQDTRETAISNNSLFIPEVIFDHVDRISHIDDFKLRIKYDTIRF